jgi:hypothetical protein
VLVRKSTQRVEARRIRRILLIEFFPGKVPSLERLQIQRVPAPDDQRNSDDFSGLRFSNMGGGRRSSAFGPLKDYTLLIGGAHA